MAMSEAMEREGETPSPETIGMALRIYADLFTAFESAPLKFNGFSCNGLDEQKQPITVSMDSMSMDGFRPGVYPAISMDGLNISVEGDGQVGIDNFSMKEMDLAGPIAAVEAAPETIDQAWLDANARSLIPAFAGFSVGWRLG